MSKSIVFTLSKTLKKILIGAIVIALWNYALNDGGSANLFGGGFIGTGLIYACVAWFQFVKNDNTPSFSMMGQNGTLLRTGDEIASRLTMLTSVKPKSKSAGICCISSWLAALVFILIGILVPIM